MTDGCPRLGQQIVGLRFRRDKARKGGDKQHPPRIVPPVFKNVIRFTSRADFFLVLHVVRFVDGVILVVRVIVLGMSETVFIVDLEFLGRLG